jgi:hypothetical protein
MKAEQDWGFEDFIAWCEGRDYGWALVHDKQCSPVQVRWDGKLFCFGEAGTKPTVEQCREAVAFFCKHQSLPLPWDEPSAVPNTIGGCLAWLAEHSSWMSLCNGGGKDRLHVYLGMENHQGFGPPLDLATCHAAVRWVEMRQHPEVHVRTCETCAFRATHGAETTGPGLRPG